MDSLNWDTSDVNFSGIIELCTTKFRRTKRNIDGSILLTINPEQSRRIDYNYVFGSEKVNKGYFILKYPRI